VLDKPRIEDCEATHSVITLDCSFNNYNVSPFPPFSASCGWRKNVTSVLLRLLIGRDRKRNLLQSATKTSLAGEFEPY
jgi:hypothetical protein